jgi:hypothetical protein
MSAPDDQSGGKNAIQARGSTVTYLQRYTLLSAFGLVAADEDDDGRKGVKPEPPPADEFADLLGAWISKTAGPASPLCGYRVSAYDVQAVKDVMRAEVPKAKLPKTAQAAMAWIEGHIHVVAQTDDKGEVAGVEFALLTGAPKAGGVRADELPL